LRGAESPELQKGTPAAVAEDVSGDFGHRHPQLLQAASPQLERVTLTSRAVYRDRFGPFCGALAELCGMGAVLLMNTGAEAVETAIKTAGKWGYEVRGSRPTGPRSSPAPTASTAAPSPW
jgi:adenosylmethionine-8-amino-7-oxononanoate aminotransferase